MSTLNKLNNWKEEYRVKGLMYRIILNPRIFYYFRLGQLSEADRKLLRRKVRLRKERQIAPKIKERFFLKEFLHSRRKKYRRLRRVNNFFKYVPNLFWFIINDAVVAKAMEEIEWFEARKEMLYLNNEKAYLKRQQAEIARLRKLNKKYENARIDWNGNLIDLAYIFAYHRKPHEKNNFNPHIKEARTRHIANLIETCFYPGEKSEEERWHRPTIEKYLRDNYFSFDSDELN